MENNSSMDVEYGGLEMCSECDGTPCDWIKIGQELLTEVELKYPENARPHDVENYIIRKSAYRIFMYLKHGFLVRGYYFHIGSCVIQKIREKWPENDGNYTDGDD